MKRDFFKDWAINEYKLMDGSIVYDVTDGKIILHARDEISADLLMIALKKYTVD